jgi:MoaA/NifB/PqqE/SkfB family radical SAM enzyme
MVKSWPRSFLFKTPFTCNVKVTTRCNLKCGFCGLWSLPVTRELHLDNYRYIADLLQELGLARVVITGGEPLLRSDTPEIINLFSRRGFSTTLLTNGTLANESLLKKMVDLGLNDIGISLDSLRPEVIESVCGRKNIWNRIVDSIRLAVSCLPDGIVEVLTTVTGNNLHEIPDIVHFVTDNLGAWSVINPVHVPPGPDAILSADSDTISPPFAIDKVDTVYDKLLEMKSSGKKILVSNRFLKESRRYLKTGEFHWRCDAGERYFTIFPDGGLAPCSDQKSVANVMDMSAGDFKRSEYLEVVRNDQKNCGGCIFSCWREASYLFTDYSVWLERLRSLHQIRRGSIRE